RDDRDLPFVTPGQHLADLVGVRRADHGVGDTAQAEDVVRRVLPVRSRGAVEHVALTDDRGEIAGQRRDRQAAYAAALAATSGPAWYRSPGRPRRSTSASHSAVAISPSISTPVSMPSPSNRYRRSSVAMLPVARGANGQPPSPPIDASN